MTTNRPTKRRPRQPVGLALAGGGILLRRVMAAVAVTEVAVGVEALAQAQAVFLTNSLIGVRPAASLWWKALASVPRIGGMALRAATANGLRGLSASAWDTLERVARTLPAGVLDANAAEQTLKRLFATEHGSDDFRRLPSRLRIVATDIDTGQPVEFGAPGFDDVPISRAVIASSAVPGIFAPVLIGERYFVDGALNKTLHASVALNDGVRLLFCVNPLVPFNDGAATRPGVIAQAGLTVILSQSIRTAIRSRMTTGLEKYDSTHPDAQLIVLEPRSNDTALFFTRIFAITSRRRVCW